MKHEIIEKIEKNMVSQKLKEVVSGRDDERPVTMGDFVPHSLLYLGKGRESKLWAIGCLRSETSPPARQSFAPAACLRESCVLAWLILSRSLLATMSQATTYLRGVFRSTTVQHHHHDQPSK